MNFSEDPENEVRPVAALDLRVIGKIVLSRVFTLPVEALPAALFFFILTGIFV